MRIAVSNIALAAYDHAAELAGLAAFGIAGVEVAPSRVWRDTWHGLGAAQVERYRHTLEKAGLSVVGLHSLFYDHPELGLFREPELRRETLDYLVHLSAVCRDLGGRSLIWGGGRRRGAVTADDAIRETVAFMAELCPRIADHGTCLCFEPLGPQDTDFIHHVAEALAIVEAVSHPALAVQIDAKALVANGEAEPGTFQAATARLAHFHANEPDLGILGSSRTIDHAAMGTMLRQVGYDGWVTIEQRQLDPADALGPIGRSAAIARACYGD